MQGFTDTEICEMGKEDPTNKKQKNLTQEVSK